MLTTETEFSDGGIPTPLKSSFPFTPELLRDWEFYEALARIMLTASEQPNLNPFWRLAYEQLAFACDHLTALIFRQDQRPEFGP